MEMFLFEILSAALCDFGEIALVHHAFGLQITLLGEMANCYA